MAGAQVQSTTAGSRQHSRSGGASDQKNFDRAMAKAEDKQARDAQKSNAKGADAKASDGKEPEKKDDGGFSFSDIGHTVLDVVGMVPVVGEAADLANAGWYAAEGDYTNAALSAAGAIPFAGNAATAAKWGKKAVDAADMVSDGAKIIDKGGDVSKAVKAADGAGDAAKTADKAGDAAKGADAPPTKKADDVEGTKPPAPKPKIEAGHILDGEINKKGKAVGYHHRAGGADAANARMTSQTNPPDVNGVYTGKVEIKDQVANNWVAKKAESSFYPDKLSRQEVVESIESAWANKTSFNSATGRFEGPSGHGFDVQGYFRDGEIKTAFPLRQ